MHRVRRLFEELRFAPTREDARAALSALRIGDDGVVSAGGAGAPLLDEHAPLPLVRIAPGVYGAIPTSDARVELLRRAQSLAPEVALHVRTSDDAPRAARILVDAPRRVLRALHVPRVAEPGDRFTEQGFAHAFFDDEPILVEIARAGLAVVERRPGELLLRDAARTDARTDEDDADDADAFAREVARVLAAFWDAERRRRNEAPASAVRAMRRRGASMPRRGAVGRARLRRAIGWVDALMPGGPNCYRRTLLELALDRGAASETLVFGLDVGRTGHVAFVGREDRTFDVAYEIGADDA